MAYDPSIFNINPYYDDFDAAKGFLRVLFKPGYALQARELTQAQSILQNQLSTVADHLFKDGSRIIGGGITVRNANYLMVDAGLGSQLENVTDYSPMVGGVLEDSEGNKARIVHFLPPDASSDNHLILVVDYLSGFSMGETAQFIKDGEAISGISLSISYEYGTPSSMMCKVIAVSDGIFYVDGFFVRVETQRFSPYRVIIEDDIKYRDLSFTVDTSVGSNFFLLSNKIGFVVNRDTVTEQEDDTLRDPSIGSYNYNAPGADRYKMNLVLDQVGLDETPDDFVELLRFNEGKITKKIDRVVYGDILNALAQRTYDESGSYTVKPFDVSMKPGLNENLLTASISGGKAYVLGYEVENQHPSTIQIQKARTTQTEIGNRYPFSVGHQVGVRLVDIEEYGLTFTQNIVSVGSASAIVKFFDAETNMVAQGYVHGAIPNPSELSTTGTSRIGYEYSLYLYGVSGNIASAVSGYIYSHPDGQTYSPAEGQPFVNTEGLTIGFFVPSGVNTNFINRFTDYSSLVYPIEPGYAVDSIQSMTVLGKIIGNSAIESPVRVTTNNNITRFTFNKTHFSSTILPNADTAFRFRAYGSETNPSRNSGDLTGIAFIRSSETGASKVMTAFGLDSRVFTNSDRSEVTVVVPNAPEEFQNGFIRAVCPIEYTPNILNQYTYRRKVSTEITETLSGIQEDENGRRYYQFPRIDVYAVLSVSRGTVDYTNDFELDDGQHCCYYDNSRLYIKESVSREERYTTSPISVSVNYRYFEHQGLQSAPFIGKHSYDIPYDQIPLYTNPRNGQTVSLANCLDFRHSGLTSDIPMIKPYGRSEFGLEGDTVVSYTHYLPRIDKLCVKSDPEDGSPLFFVVSGTPDITPTAPSDPEDALVISTITLPAYTHNPENVVVTPVDTKRYTMGDIGKIEKRIDDVEVFAKLSLSEVEAESKPIVVGGQAIDHLKTSIFSDEFYGHSIADVNDDAFSCSIDYERGELRPFFKEMFLGLSDPTTSKCVVSPDGIATLDYTNSAYIENKQYTKTVKVNPSGTVNWLGFMSLSHQVDPYFDTKYRPIIRTNSLMENDNWQSANPGNMNGFGTQWNSWDSMWTGIEQIDEEQDDIQKRIVEVPHSSSISAIQSFNSGNVRIGTSRKIDSVDQKTSKFMRARHLRNRIKFAVGSRLVDRSVVPYINGKSGVSVSVHGLKPNSQNLTLYFDGEPIKTGITADAHGSVTGVTFDIPQGKFLAGSRTVRLSDSSEVSNSYIAADSVYYCNGILEQRDSGSFSTRPPQLRRLLASSESIAKDPFNRDIDSIEGTHWTDPLSQTFFVDKKSNPDGIQISSVRLYFSSKDDTLPVTVQIRPTVGGYPSPSVVLPFSTVTLMPNQVNAEGSPTATEFVFSTPVYLEPGEYSICIIANSDNYSVYAAETAINAVANADADSGRAGNNQLVGTLFTAQGFGPAVPDPLTDLMFEVMRCNFESSGSLTWLGNSPSPSASELSKCVSAQVIKVYAPEVIPTSCTITRTIGTNTFQNNDSLYLRTLFSSSPTVQYTMSRGYNVSPMVDLRAMYFSAIHMFENPQTPISRYVSKIVELPQDNVSNGLAVFMDANLQGSSKIDVYCRYTVDGETDLLQKQWVRLPLTFPSTPQISSEKPFTSTSEIDFRSANYATTQPIDSIKSYQIRVDLFCDPNYTYYSTPAVRNLKVVSFIR